MYIFIFLVVLGMTTFITNKQNEVESNYEFLKWSSKDILIISATAGVALLLQILDGIFLPKFFMLVYLIGSVISLVLVNKFREQYIQEYKKQLGQIIEAMGGLFKIKDEEINYNDLPFKIEKDGDLVNKIIVQMKDPQKFNDGNCTNAVYSLKRYFPYYDWQYTTDFPKQECVFEGQKLPPDVAKWPGDDLRRSPFIPLGLSGDGEVGWALTSKGYGESSYVFEDGSVAGTAKLPSAPQALVVGSTGGGKSIWVDQEVW